MLVPDEVVGAGDEGDEVRRQRLGRLQLPHARLGVARRGVADHDPVVWGADVEGVGRLEVGLVEAGEDAGRGVHEGHAVDVVAPVGRVDRAVQTLPVVAEAHDGVDDELVTTGGELQGQPAVAQLVDVERVVVEGDRADRGRLQVQEGAARVRGEPDAGQRAEGLLRARQVEGDVVGVDDEEVRTGARLAALETADRLAGGLGELGHAATLRPSGTPSSTRSARLGAALDRHRTATVTNLSRHLCPCPATKVAPDTSPCAAGALRARTSREDTAR